MIKVKTVAEIPNTGSLRMLHCYFCGQNNFVPKEYPPMHTLPCGRCQREIMVPVMMRQFEVRQAIATGGMGTVYRAFDTVLHREVAVKLLRADMASDQAKLDEFYREARTIATFNHPNIIQIFNFGEYEGKNFIAMELADKGSLENRITQKGKLTELEVLDVGVKIAGALDAALKQELLHRDIKPANILFNGVGEPKLVDFGLARKSDAETEYGAEIWGTPEYVAPETVQRQPETFLSDMYSLGATLYQALTGQVPFVCDTVEKTVTAHVRTPVTPPNKLVPEISRATSDAITKTLAKKPKDRFASYDELIMALTAARSQLLVGQMAKDEPETPAKPARTTRKIAPTPSVVAGEAKKGKGGLIAAVVVVLAAAAGAGWYFTQKKGEETASTPTTAATPKSDTASTLVPTPPPQPPVPVAEEKAPAPVVKLNTLPHPEATGPWVSLTGTNYANLWHEWNRKNFPAKTWKVQGGFITVENAESKQLLVTKRKYVDFELQFEWQVAEGTRAALLIGVNDAIPDNAPASALKFPLVHDASITNVNPARQQSGALEGLIAPDKNKKLKPPGQFNQSTVIVLKRRVEFWLNGMKVTEFSLDSDKFKEAVAKNQRLKDKPYFGKSTEGFIGFQPSAGIQFRSVRIRDIAEYPQVPKAAPAPAPQPQKKKK